MGYAARANRHSRENIIKRRRERGLPDYQPLDEIEKKYNVHIPNSTLSTIDAQFMAMFKGLRPATPDEHAELEASGMDLRPPDIVLAEKKREALESTKPKARQPEVRLIKLTDED